MLAANIAMLVHAVVPHHRHSSLLAAAFIHVLDYGTQEEGQAFHHGDEADGHAAAASHHSDRHHDGDHHEGDDDCRVDEACIASFTLRRHDDLAPTPWAGMAPLTALPADASGTIISHHGGSGLPFRHKPYAGAWCAAPLGRTMGLRAPPVG